MKTTLVLYLLFFLASCSDSTGEKLNQDELSSRILAILDIKTDHESEANSGIVGIWRSRSSHTILLVGKDQKAVLLSVLEFGDIVVGSDDSVSIRRSELHDGIEPFGYLVDGRIVQKKDDTSEYFLKVE